VHILSPAEHYSLPYRPIFRRFQDSYQASASVVFGAENLSMADELRNALEVEDGAWGKYWLLQSGTQHSRDNKEGF
jgi:hypothetical protein